jgi:hypothetical protein
MIADTLSDAVEGIDYYLKNDAFEAETLDEILRVRGEMENLRIALDRMSFVGVDEFMKPVTNPEVAAVLAAFEKKED